MQRVLIEQAVDIAREAYFGLVIDRTSQRITIIACDGGGVEDPRDRAPTSRRASCVKRWTPRSDCSIPVP